MRRTVIAWIAGTAIGVLLIALPDADSRLLTFSSAHGPGLLDAAGALVATAASALAWWQIWRRRRTLGHLSRTIRYGLFAAAGVGAGLIVASVFGDFPAWWAVGACLLIALQIGLLIRAGAGVRPPPVRTRVTGYVTRTTGEGLDLLVFDYLTNPRAGTQLPGGGAEPGELLDGAMLREVVEETGVTGELSVGAVVGAQRSRYTDTGRPYVNVFFQLDSTETRDSWEHTVSGDDHAWDTGLTVRCRFLPLTDAGAELTRAGHGQDAFLGLLRPVSRPAR